MFPLPFSVKVNVAQPNDYWQGPWTSVSDANANVPAGIRYQGRPVTIIEGGESKIFWYKNGIADSDLEEFSSGGGDTIFSGGAMTNPSTIIGDGNDLSITGLNSYTMNISNGVFGAGTTFSDLGERSFWSDGLGQTTKEIGIRTGFDTVEFSTGVRNSLFVDRVSNLWKVESLFTGDSSSIETTSSDGLTVLTDQIGSFGAKYADDYSSNGILDPLWIPNWGTVTDLVANSGGETIFTGGTMNSDSLVDINSLNTLEIGYYTEENLTGGFANSNELFNGINFTRNQLRVTNEDRTLGRSTGFILADGNAQYGFNSGNDSIFLTVTETEFLIEDSIGNKGLKYVADYSVNGMIDPLWIPNWGAVTDLVANSAVDTVFTGGIMTASSEIDPVNNTLRLGKDRGIIEVSTYLDISNNNLLLLSRDNLFGDPSIDQAAAVSVASTGVLYYYGTPTARVSAEYNNNGIIITDTLNNFGSKYATDYSVNGVLDPLWIPHWSAVTDLVTGAGVTAGTGLTNTLGTFSVSDLALGGEAIVFDDLVANTGAVPEPTNSSSFDFNTGYQSSVDGTALFSEFSVSSNSLNYKTTDGTVDSLGVVSIVDEAEILVRPGRVEIFVEDGGEDSSIRMRNARIEIEADDSVEFDADTLLMDGTTSIDFLSDGFMIFEANDTLRLNAVTNEIRINGPDSSGSGIEIESQDGGMFYPQDYSVLGIATFGDRWIPDWGIVNNLVENAYAFEEGLTLTSGVATLGGSFVNDIAILPTVTGVPSFEIGSAALNVNEFNVWGNSMNLESASIINLNIPVATVETNFLIGAGGSQFVTNNPTNGNTNIQTTAGTYSIAHLNSPLSTNYNFNQANLFINHQRGFGELDFNLFLNESGFRASGREGSNTSEKFYRIDSAFLFGTRITGHSNTAITNNTGNSVINQFLMGTEEISMTVGNVAQFKIESDEATFDANNVTFEDFRATPRGIEYFADYYATSTEFTLMSKGDVRKVINETPITELENVETTSLQQDEGLYFNNVTQQFENRKPKRTFTVELVRNNTATGGQQPLFRGRNATWNNGGQTNANVYGVTIPFDCKLTEVLGNVFQIGMNQAPGANIPNIQFQLREIGFNDGGTLIDSEISLPLNAVVGNFTGLQQTGPSGQSDKMSVLTDIDIPKGTRLSITFEGKFTTTEVNQINDSTFLFIFEETI